MNARTGNYLSPRLTRYVWYWVGLCGWNDIQSSSRSHLVCSQRHGKQGGGQRDKCICNFERGRALPLQLLFHGSAPLKPEAFHCVNGNKRCTNNYEFTKLHHFKQKITEGIQLPPRLHRTKFCPSNFIYLPALLFVAS